MDLYRPFLFPFPLTLPFPLPSAPPLPPSSPQVPEHLSPPPPPGAPTGCYQLLLRLPRPGYQPGRLPVHRARVPRRLSQRVDGAAARRRGHSGSGVRRTHEDTGLWCGQEAGARGERNVGREFAGHMKTQVSGEGRGQDARLFCSLSVLLPWPAPVHAHPRPFWRENCLYDLEGEACLSGSHPHPSTPIHTCLAPKPHIGPGGGLGQVHLRAALQLGEC